tara:strand:- start:1234 stop:1509 length:276 start_codon:yes stop_codon:yes gene_type:complete
MNDKEIEQQINDIIEGEIQNNINEYLEQQQKIKGEDGGLGFANNEGGQLNVKISKDEVAKLVKEYKKQLKYRKSNLFQASQLLVDKNGEEL